MAENRPNLLLVMTDQHRFDALGCSGGWVSTPNLDRIAAEGVRYSNCVTTSPVCVPARLNLATGRYCHNTGIWNNCHFTMPADTPTWIQAIRTAGYRTSLFGKTHWHPHQGDLRDREHLLRAYGFDDIVEVTGPRASTRTGSHMTDAWEAAGQWQAFKDDYADRFAVRPQVVRPSPLDPDLYYDAYVGEQTVRYLREYDRPEPWCCWVSFPGPHEPWDTPEPYAGMYDPAQMPRPAPVPKNIADRPVGKLDDMLAHPPVHLNEADPGKLRADYAGNISLIDAQIGRILAVLEERGTLDNTVIVFTSDHGEMNGDCGLIYKGNFMDGAVRVPLIVRTPQTAREAMLTRLCSSPIEWIDVGPTLVELAGGMIKHQQFGRTLTSTLSDPTTFHRPDALSEVFGEIMLLSKSWKVAANQRGEIYLLFDRLDDPGETINLAGSSDPDIVSLETDLRQRILERLLQSQIRDDLNRAPE